MSEIIFEVLKLAVMVAVLLISRYAVPWLQTKIDAEQLSVVAEWAGRAVLQTQQVLESAGGTEKKAVVTKFLKELLTTKKIALSDEQLDCLIEAAVRQMKIQENQGIVIEATDNVPETETIAS